MTGTARALVVAPPQGAGETPSQAPSWRATLDLRYERVEGRSVLVERSHSGPLRVQKTLYPEGDAVCQNIVVHPPGGIVGGDALAISASAGTGSHVQLTTPGAAKWYGSAGAAARQRVVLRVAGRAAIEWLPRESIIFDGAIAELDVDIELDGDAVFLGWDVVCLGRTAAAETFDSGLLRQRTRVARDDAPVFIERSHVQGGGRLLASPVGLNGASVYGTLFAAAPEISDAVLSECRGVTVPREDSDKRQAVVAVTRLPGLLLARYRGASTEAAHNYFVQLWQHLRPALLRRAAVPPRIWKT